ncbi:MAG: ATP-binding protein [Micropruina sp.]
MRATRALVGRTAELERAVTALGLTEDAGGVLVLSGDAGIGKTRLLREVAGHAERPAGPWRSDTVSPRPGRTCPTCRSPS